jgi:hypothetical protein
VATPVTVAVTDDVELGVVALLAGMVGGEAITVML